MDTLQQEVGAAAAVRRSKIRRRKLISLLQGLEHTMLVATHDLGLALELCPRTILMADGAVAADDRTRALFADARTLDRHGLEQPPQMAQCPACGALPTDTV